MANEKPQARKPAIKDYYKLLGISPGAELEEIEKAYGRARQAAEFKHIDLKDVETAYAIFKDPELRQQYDAALEKIKSAEASGIYKMSADSSFVAVPSAPRSAPVVFAPPSGKAEKSRTALLLKILAVAVVLGLAGGVYLYSQRGFRLKKFAVGETLLTGAGKEFGTVEEIGPHEFPPGKTVRAVRIKLKDGSEVWYPYVDVQANYHARK